jgi:hypothetical protein
MVWWAKILNYEVLTNTCVKIPDKCGRWIQTLRLEVVVDSHPNRPAEHFSRIRGHDQHEIYVRTTNSTGRRSVVEQRGSGSGTDPADHLPDCTGTVQ